MHVPLDYLFGTYAGSKQEVGLGWGTLSHCLASRSLRSGAVSPLGRRLTIPPYIRPVRNRIKSSKKTRHSSLIITFLISCDSWLESNEVDRIILKSPELAQLRRLDSTYLICSVWIESIVRWAKRWEDQSQPELSPQSPNSVLTNGTTEMDEPSEAVGVKIKIYWRVKSDWRSCCKLYSIKHGRDTE